MRNKVLLLPAQFRSPTISMFPFYVYLVPSIWQFCSLLISLFKVAPRRVLKCCLILLNATRLWCSLWKNNSIKCWISFIQASVMVLLAMNSVLMNQQSVSYKESLNRNTHKTKWWIDWLMKIWPEAQGNFIFVFLLEAVFSGCSNLIEHKDHK